MVKPKARSVERGGIGIAGIELRYPRSAVVWSVRQRIRVQKRPQSCRSILPRVAIRDGRKRGLWQTKAQAFVGEEEERPILKDWAVKCPAKIVLMLPRLGQTLAVRKPIVGVKEIVADVIERRSVPLVGARTGHDRNLASGRTAELGGKRRRLDSKFLHGVHGNKTICS